MTLQGGIPELTLSAQAHRLPYAASVGNPLLIKMAPLMSTFSTNTLQPVVVLPAFCQHCSPLICPMLCDMQRGQAGDGSLFSVPFCHLFYTGCVLVQFPRA